MRPPDSKKSGRRWIWFFVVLGVLASSGIAVEIWFNLNQQLKPERLALARALWRENQPRDYTLEYEIKRESTPDPAGPPPERYTVRVSQDKVVSVTLPAGQPLAKGQYQFDSMDSVFAYIDERLQADLEPGSPRPFVVATFDPRDGHVSHYVRSVMRTRERLEISIRLLKDE